MWIVAATPAKPSDRVFYTQTNLWCSNAFRSSIINLESKNASVFQVWGQRDVESETTPRNAMNLGIL